MEENSFTDVAVLRFHRQLRAVLESHLYPLLITCRLRDSLCRNLQGRGSHFWVTRSLSWKGTVTPRCYHGNGKLTCHTGEHDWLESCFCPGSVLASPQFGLAPEPHLWSQVPLLTSLLCTKPCAAAPHTASVEGIILLAPFYRRGNWGFKKVRKLPKAT